MEENKVSEKLILIAGSSGSLEALLKIFVYLKKDFAIPILLVLHRHNDADESLGILLSTKINLKVKEADEKDELLPGNVYIAPPDYHLLIEQDQTISLDATPKVNYSRPSIDVSMSSAANVYEEKLVAVLLSGANSDGSLGMKIIQEKGGIIIVQDPAECVVPYMPEQAIVLTKTVNVMTTKEIAAFLNALEDGKS